jgi:hypothetical protein
LAEALPAEELLHAHALLAEFVTARMAGEVRERG